MTSRSATASRRRDEIAAKIALWMFFILVFVGFSPFKPHESDQISEGDGNAFRQIAYVALFLFYMYIYQRDKNRLVIFSIPLSTTIVLSFIVLSTFWSVSPDITIRRSILVVMVTSCMFAVVDLYGVSWTLRELRNVLALVMIVDILSVPIIPGATHPYYDVMAWAGLHGHKNIAGAVATLAALVFQHFIVQDNKWSDRVLFCIAILFVVGTYSKTSIVLLIGLLIFAQFYRLCERRKALQRAFIYLLIFLAVVAAVIFYTFQDELFLVLEDPNAFTGRGAIWAIVLNHAYDHIWLGAGFGAFWEGVTPPARQYMTANWQFGIGHAHNSYLELLASTGLIGLGLAVIALLVLPLSWALRFSVADGAGALALCWELYVLIGSFTKSPLLERDSPEWVSTALFVAILFHSVKRRVFVAYTPPARPDVDLEPDRKLVDRPRGF